MVTKMSVELLLVGIISLVFLSACKKNVENGQVNIAPPPVVQKEGDLEIDQKRKETLEKLLTIPRGTTAFQEWHEFAKSAVAPELYDELGIGYFYQKQLPTQKFYDDNPNYYNTGLGNNPIGLKVASGVTLTKQYEDGYQGSFAMVEEFGAQQSEEQPHEFEVAFSGNKIAILDGTHLDRFKALKPMTVSDYQKQNGKESVSSPVASEHVDSINEHLTKAIKAFDQEEYFFGNVSESYTDEFWNGKRTGNIKLATAIKRFSGILDELSTTAKLSQEKNVVEWTAYIVSPEDKSVVAVVEGVMYLENSVYELTKVEVVKL